MKRGCTLRWLFDDVNGCLTFAEKPGSLNPDPVMGVSERAEKGICVCYCRLPPCERLSEDDLALGGQPSEEERDRGNGAVPYCRLHKRRRAPRRLKCTAAAYVECREPPVFSDGIA